MESPVTVCLFGHSYIRRFDEFMRDNRDEYGNLGFDNRDVSVYCVGVGGATVRPGAKCIVDYVHEALARTPDIMYLHVGENDFRSSYHHPSVTVSDICSLVDRLSPPVRLTYVSQLLSFPAAAEKKNAIVEVNQSLEAHYRNADTVKVWRHRGGFWNVSNQTTTSADI